MARITPPTRPEVTLTKLGALLGIGVAALTGGFVGLAAVQTGLLAGDMALSALALGGVSWASYKSAKSSEGVLNHHVTRTVPQGVSTLAKWGGVLFTLGGLAMVATAASAAVVAPELLVGGLLYATVGYSAFRSGQGADIARYVARTQPAPAPAPVRTVSAPAVSAGKDKPVLGKHTARLAEEQSSGRGSAR